MLTAKLRWHTGLLVFLLAQAIALLLAGLTDGTTRALALAGSGVFTIVGAAAAVSSMYRWRQRNRNLEQRLAQWVEGIDVAADASPEADTELAAVAPRLSAAVDSLVGRLHDYREKLLIRHQRMQRMLRNVTDVLYFADAEGRLTWVTESVTDMLGYTLGELKNTSLAELLVDPDIDLPVLTERPSNVRHPTRVYRADGGVAWLLISSRRIDDAEGRPIGSEGICRDGTRLIETERQLDQEKERAQVTLAAIGDGVITTDARGRVDYINPRGRHMLECDTASAQGAEFEHICRLFDTESQQFVTGLIEDCLKAGKPREWVKALSLADGETPPTNALNGRSVTVTVSPIRDDRSQIIGSVVVLHDVTRLERISRELTYQANHDPLTGLLNRRAFERQLRNALEGTRGSTVQHILCYLDLDQFKLINDSCGHHAGDAMLRQLSSQMATQLRPDDTLARLGGDEFGIIFQATDLDAARMAAERLRRWLEQFRFEWDNKVFRLGASLGLSLIDDQTISAAEALRCADTACYLAKEQGRNQIRVYHRDSDEARMRDDEIESMQHITEALDNGGFTLHLQPIQPIGQGDRPESILGVEFLLRLTQDTGRISPQRVLLTAERYSMASRIDRWVIDHALQLIGHHAADMAQIGYYSINLSGQSITDESFVGFVRERIEHYNVDPRCLVFELTETAAVTNLQRAADLMHSLRTLGCRFALDDFGSGVSSFDYLKHLPSDFVKIDGQLVRHVTDDPIEQAIVEALSNISRAVGVRTVAEHVETGAQLETLKRLGIDAVQGYYIGRPMPLDQFTGWLHANG